MLAKLKARLVQKKVVHLMKAKNIRDLSEKELVGTLRDLKNELFNLRFQHATGQLENPQKIKLVKRDIARVNTVMRELSKRA